MEDGAQKQKEIVAPGSRLPVVIDVGTGFTKMGFGGNLYPDYITPTVISVADAVGRTPSGRGVKGIPELDFSIGDEAISNQAIAQVKYPLRHGQVDDWDLMEKFYEQCYYKYLRCEPEEHLCILTEPPLNAPENREYTAEIMFETFNVPELYIGVQAVFALAASWMSKKASLCSLSLSLSLSLLFHVSLTISFGVSLSISTLCWTLTEKSGVTGTLTGTVVDSGDGVTHVIPVVEGYVVGSAIRHIPLAGRDITDFVHHFLKERERIPTEDSLLIAQRIKEEYGYVCKDLADEFNEYDSNPEKNFKIYDAMQSRTKKKYSIDIGYEQFLGPELFFHPEIFSSAFTTPLPEVVDNVIQLCPIDHRRDLYKDIVLSGGSTMFKNFDRRLQRDIKKIANDRLAKFSSKSKIEVNVMSHEYQRFSVWLGGSLMSVLPDFGSVTITKSMYEEMGPSVARQSKVCEGFSV
eukprot:TRINITY_DN1172_c1_g1_i3.p1 TRINITY_DN1172_c1_g1~~TRINITY_DN1172_c1_g1_i3.p1  ORF type:complete len:464 (-),score=113.70 TRINITY_DN1172_c1_g1_i3:356-1747(-)